MAKILAIDDEKEILKIIKKALEKEGHEVEVSDKPSKILEAKNIDYELILLDVNMPEIDGFTLCKQIRKRVDCPIIFLTARTMEHDVMKGFSIGADDYILKPFGIGELRARVEAHIRREHRQKKNTFHICEVTFQLSAKELWIGENMVVLTKSEYEISEFLAINHGLVFSKDKIYEEVFGFNGESDSTAVVEHIKNIRRKLAKYQICPIETVWGIGYKWAE